MVKVEDNRMSEEGSSKPIPIPGCRLGDSFADKRKRGALRHSLDVTSSLIHLIVSTVIIFALAYIIGHPILEKGGVIGNDGPMHLAYTFWLDKYFPTIPHWYPIQGGGVSLLHGYPLLSHYLVVFASRVLGISLTVSFRLVVFFSFPLTAVGVYLFGWKALKRQTVGFIAAIFYLLTPITWTWVFEWGFLAQCVAMIFLPLGLVVYDQFQSCKSDGAPQWKCRLWFVGSVLILSMAMLTHPIVGAGLSGGILLYGLVTSVVGPKQGRLRRVRDAVCHVGLLGIAVALLLSFYFVPFYRYGQVANREGLNAVPLHAMNRLPIAQFLGLQQINPREVLTHMANPLILVVFFVIGIFLTARLSRKGLTLVIICLFTAVYSHVPELPYAVQKVFGIIGTLFGLRSMLVVGMILMPVCGALGAWLLAKVVLSPKSLFRDRFELIDVEEPWSVRGVITSSTALVLTVVGIAMIGPGSPIAPGIDKGSPWEIGEVELSTYISQFLPESWPPLKDVENLPISEEAQELALILPERRPLRIDISPYMGRLAMDFSTYYDTTQINLYTYTLSLNHAMWGYQTNVFFLDNSDAEEYGTPKVLTETSNWYGVEYVFLNTAEDINDIYNAAGWEIVYKKNQLEVWKYPSELSIATASSKPNILIICREDINIYEQIFRVANRGGLPYEDFWIVQGSGQIDSYRLEELQHFDAIFMHGYTYRNSVIAWDLLEKYVRQGGALYVDTGWEWTVPEWEFLNAPLVLPVSSLKWTNYGLTAEYHLNSPEISGEIDPLEFSPLTWENGPWAVSGARPEDVREWGKVVLSAANQPLVVAGEYGEGRVVWSGMNLVSHSNDKDNDEEARLLRNLIDWLTEGTSRDDFPVVTRREHPDRVEFRLEIPTEKRASLFWRESYYPAWHAYLIQDGTRREIPIYRGGPGFMLMPIEGVSGEIHIELVWETPMIERMATIISLLTATGLVIFVVDSALYKGRLFATLIKPLRLPRKKEKPRGSVEWLPDIPTNDASLSEAGHVPPSDLDQALDHTSSGGSDAFDFIEVVDEIGDREDVELLWQQLKEDGKLSSVSDEEVEKLMARWRNSKTDENE